MIFWIVGGFTANCQSVQREVPLSETDAPYGYYEYLPYDYALGDNFPMIVYLHGLGEVGDGENELQKLLIHGPHKLIASGKEFPALIVAPQSKSWWDIAKLGDFVDWCMTTYRVDSTRIYITGNSMGGGGAWLYARDFPDVPAAVVPICGAADSSQTKNLVDIPVWAFHNVGDPIVDVKQTRDWIAGIRAAGGDPKMKIYSGNDHDSWTETYEDDDVWNWMFAQSKASKPLGLSEKKRKADIYPNPFENFFSIKTNGGGVKNLALYDTQGRSINCEAMMVESDHYMVRPDPLNSRLYFLKVEIESEVFTYRVIKK